MTTQTKIDFNSGEELRDKGIKQAIDNANDKVIEWSDHAYSFLLEYIKKHSSFMTEDLRNASHGHVPQPPSNRAWGGIIVRAAKNKLIVKGGFANVKNPKAHCTPATIWIVNENKVHGHDTIKIIGNYGLVKKLHNDSVKKARDAGVEVIV